MEHTDLKILGKSKEAVETLQRGIGSGMWLIDTTEMYAAGHLRTTGGRAIKDFPEKKSL